MQLSTTMDKTQVYRGNCHCGAYRFQVDLPELVSATSCNCSLCHKLGSLWAFVAPGSMTITKGDETNLTTYATPCATIKFCNHCGIVVSGEHSIGPLAHKLAVNIRTVLGINPFKIDIKQVDSKTSEAPHTAPDFEGDEPAFECEAAKLYNASCHCGRVTAVLKAPSPPGIETRECNCSICVRVAWIGIYPRKKQVAVMGREHTTEYFCGGRVQGWPFCQVCAVHVFANAYGPSKELMETWPEARQEMVRVMWDVLPLNLRALNEDSDLFQVEQSDEGTDGYVLD
ncbi:hypothetical protein GQ53DRAFT_713508 [Thozetella sp. PMI_491]|nr:hypothetical protein GQ53DRAFT_713508 [Thozetella sp. PMI_491]